MGAAIVVVLFLLVFGAVKAVVIVPNGSAYVIERVGRYRRTLPPGLNFIMPIVDRIAFKHVLMPQTEELSDVYETKDQHRATLAASFRFQVLDAHLASYAAADYLDLVRHLMRTSQKRYVETQTWDALREDTRSLEREVLNYVLAPAEAVGVRVLEYQVRDLQLV
jgi:regulator of protease activity HflC (stomatin/prohibitin superfamily)